MSSQGVAKWGRLRVSVWLEIQTLFYSAKMRLLVSTSLSTIRQTKESETMPYKREPEFMEVSPKALIPAFRLGDR